MFKLTGSSGSRRAGGGGASAGGRIDSGYSVHVSDLALSQHRRPAFMPDTPQEQTMDSNSPRLSGLEDIKK